MGDEVAKVLVGENTTHNKIAHQRYEQKQTQGYMQFS